jgi:hypothetical protein
MNAKRLPLALELTKPVLLAGDLEADLHSEFDPKTQMSSNTHTRQSTTSLNPVTGILSDVSVDVAVDDVIA